MRNLLTKRIVVSAALAALVSACAGEDEIIPEGLSVLDMDEAAGALVVAYRADGRTIRYEMRLGGPMATPPTAEELAQNPELPTHDVDVRVLDSDGRPMLLQMAGHAFIDDSWARSPVIADFDEQGRLADLELLRAAGPGFRDLALPPALEELRRAGIQLGALPADDAAEKPEVIAERAAKPGVIAWGPSSVAKWDFVVRRKPFGCCGVGHHSAVELRGWSSSSSIVYRAYSCNHGTCASNTSVMTNHCVMPGFKTDDGTHSRYFYSDGCTTRYNVTSVWGHNCNDDSELQGRAIWHDRSQSTTGGSCNSAGPHNYAPGCTY
jgi:hypothetical protein